MSGNVKLLGRNTQSLGVGDTGILDETARIGSTPTRSFRLADKSIGKQKSETAIVKEVIRAVNYIPGVRVWRQNTGAVDFRDPDSRRRFVRFGLVGSADITGVAPGGIRLEIECKRPGCKQNDSQINYENTIRDFGAIYILVHYAAEAVELVHKAILERSK